MHLQCVQVTAPAIQTWKVSMATTSIRQLPKISALNCLGYFKTHLTQSSLSTQLRTDLRTNASAAASTFRAPAASVFHTTREALL